MCSDHFMTSCYVLMKWGLISSCFSDFVLGIEISMNPCLVLLSFSHPSFSWCLLRGFWLLYCSLVFSIWFCRKACWILISHLTQCWQLLFGVEVDGIAESVLVDFGPDGNFPLISFTILTSGWWSKIGDDALTCLSLSSFDFLLCEEIDFVEDCIGDWLLLFLVD